ESGFDHARLRAQGFEEVRANSGALMLGSIEKCNPPYRFVRPTAGAFQQNIAILQLPARQLANGEASQSTGASDVTVIVNICSAQNASISWQRLAPPLACKAFCQALPDGSGRPRNFRHTPTPSRTPATLPPLHRACARSRS